MSESTYDRKTFVGVGLFALIWLLAVFFLGCGHIQIVNEAPNTGPASYAKPDPGRF